MGSGVSVDDKIHFVAPETTLAVDGREHPHDTDINRGVAPNEFGVAEILNPLYFCLVFLLLYASLTSGEHMSLRANNGWARETASR